LLKVVYDIVNFNIRAYIWLKGYQNGNHIEQSEQRLQDPKEIHRPTTNVTILEILCSNFRAIRLATKRYKLHIPKLKQKNCSGILNIKESKYGILFLTYSNHYHLLNLKTHNINLMLSFNLS